MRLTSDSVALVLAGVWNDSVVTPPWFAQHGLGLKEGVLNVQALSPFTPYGTMAGPPSYTIEGQATFTVQPHALVLKPAGASAEALDRISQIATNILRELRHTPVAAGGYNVGFEVEDPGVDLLTEFRQAQLDIVDAVPAGWTVSGNKIHTSLSKDGISLNAVKEFQQNKVSLTFNFHMPATSTEALCELLEANPFSEAFATAKEIAVSVLKENFSD